MSKCSYCGSTIIMGGAREGAQRFCNARCHQRGILLVAAQKLPADLIQKETWKVYQGQCPKCHGGGPVDVHTSYRVWSAFVLTSWANTPQVCCRSCGVKAKVAGTFFSLGLGWWGFPWGFIMTPVQVFRNLSGLMKTEDPTHPSPALENMVRISLGSKALSQEVATAGKVPQLTTP